MRTLIARLVRGTLIVDHAAQRFNSARSLLVLALGSESFFEAYGEAAFSAGAAYRADSSAFRHRLFDWEARAIRTHFPQAPAHILVGGAGGGREPFALQQMGYAVTAFDPALGLVQTLHARGAAQQGPKVRAYCGGYEHLPVMPARADIPGGDLSQDAPYDAAILGWASFSHLTTDARRVSALRSMAALTSGPLLVSYFSTRAGGGTSGRGGNWLRRRAARWGHSMFTPAAGYVRLLTDEEFASMVAQAGLAVVHAERDAEFPHAVLRRASTTS